MSHLESNIFPLQNLSSLSTFYKSYLIKGLNREHEQFFANRNELEKKISYQLRTPALVLQQGQEFFLILPVDAPEPELEHRLIRQQILLVPHEERHYLSFADRDPATDPILLRFLQFQVQAPLYDSPLLWQPSSGRGFFTRGASFTLGDICGYQGFSVRPVLTPDGGIGLCLDAVTMYVGKYPINEQITAEQFNKHHKGQNLIYRFGYNWHEIQAEHLSELSVTEYKVDDRNLLAYITDETTKNGINLTQEILQLRPDGRVLTYQDNLGRERAAPSALCYPVYGTQHPTVASNHQKTQLAPHKRRGLILGMARRFLSNLQFGGIRLEVAAEPLRPAQQPLAAPALEFGHRQVLATQAAQSTNYGQHKLRLLSDPKAGFYKAQRLRGQLLLIPKTVEKSYGQAFIGDLAGEVRKLNPQTEYQPKILTYEDQVQPTFHEVAQSIRTALNLKLEARDQFDAALVMIPQLHRSHGTTDELAAFVVKELEKHHIHNVAVIHTTIPADSYVQPQEPGKSYTVTHDERRRSRLRGYLRNVALNKIMLTNYCWPFVLAQPLHADLTIGIDVKGNTVGLAYICATGAHFEYTLKRSKQKEKLSTPQTATYIKELIEKALKYLSEKPHHIVIQRDGRLFPTEELGIERAVEALKKSGALPSTSQVTLLELAKTAPVSLRLFKITGAKGAERVENPDLGTSLTIDERSGFVCTTGIPLLHGINGTVRPLFVRRVSGSLTIEACMQDVYHLSSLTWTRPEGCMRDPITIRLLDRYLYEHAGDFDDEGLNFAEFTEPQTYTLEEVLK